MEIRRDVFQAIADSSIVSGALIEMKGTKSGDGKAVNTIVYFPTDEEFV